MCSWKTPIGKPGHTEVVYLKVSNIGDLALKYQLGVNVASETPAVNADGDQIWLSQYIKFGVVESGKVYAQGERAQAIADAQASAKLLKEGYSKSSTLYPTNTEKTTSETVALVVYMPETVGNEANYVGDAIPEINLGITLFATQYTWEKDSFDEYYDQDTAVFTVEDANEMMAEGKDTTLVNCIDPQGVLEVPADYTGTLTVVNSTVKSVQGAGDVNLVILGDVTVNAKPAATTFAATNFDGSAITAKGKLSISGEGNLTAIAADVTGAFGIGGMTTTEISIKDITIDYASGSFVQPDFKNDTKYGKTEPEGGAAIGSGYNGAKITLNKVNVLMAEGGSKAAAIGARYWTGVTINITDSTIVNAFGGNASAGIGGSRVSEGATENEKITINITNSTVTAKGGAYGAGIGSGYDTHCQDSQPLCTINIEGSTINATGGKYAAGVGTGYHNAALAGEIKNSTVTAASGEKWYKDTYTSAMDIGFGVTDPTREGKQTDSYIIYNGKKITLADAPMYKYVADGVLSSDEGKIYYVSNAAGLTWVSDTVNATTPYTPTIFDEATVLLMNDIDLGGAEWIPIGDDRFQRTEWHGVFDGQGYTISNFKITKKTDRDDADKSSYGLFGNVKGTVKNLTVSGVSISGTPKFIGALVGRLNGGLIENCHVVDSKVTCNNWTIGGLVGQFNDGKISGCSVTNTTVEGYAAVGGIAGIAQDTGDRVIENCKVENCTFLKNGSFGGDYDEMFGTVVGALYSGTLTVDLKECEVKGNTFNAAAFETLCGYVAEGDKLLIDGYQNITTPVTGTVAPLEEDFLFPAGTNAVLYKDARLSGDARIVHTENAVLGLSNVVADLDHDVIVRKSGGAICISDCEFTLTNGAKLITVGEGGDAYQVFLINVKVNGELLTDANAGQYLEGISWFGAYPEWPNT